jgi:hypothetical protein
MTIAHMLAQQARGASRRDAHGRLACRVTCQPAQSHRAIRIAFEAARLVTLPTRDAPRMYVRKGVRYSVFAEEGVIWVVQEVLGGATAPPSNATAAPDTSAQAEPPK